MQKEYDTASIDFTNEEEFYQHLDKRTMRYYEHCQSIYLTPEFAFCDKVFWQKIKLSNKINNCDIYCNLCAKIDFNATQNIRINMSI